MAAGWSCLRLGAGLGRSGAFLQLRHHLDGGYFSTRYDTHSAAHPVAPIRHISLSFSTL
jgi:hypothetical protein